MKIRPYDAKHLVSLINTWESAVAVGHPFLSERFLNAERKNISSIYLPSGDAWVVMRGETVSGFSILHGNDVGALFVRPECHGQGVGTALLNKALEIHKQLTVEVFKDNTSAVRFYLNYGFTLTREYFHKDSGMVMLCLEYKQGR